MKHATRRACVYGVISAVCLLGFQNCSQPGEVSLQSKFSSQAVNDIAIPQAGGAENVSDETIHLDDGSTPNSGDGSVTTDPATGIKVPVAEGSKEDIDNIVKQCNNSAPLSSPSSNLVLKAQGEKLALDAFKVASIDMQGARAILRSAAAGTADSTVGAVKLQGSKLILCNFTSVESIDGQGANLIYVVGSKIDSVKIQGAKLYLVNSSVEHSEAKGSKIINIVH